MKITFQIKNEIHTLTGIRAFAALWVLAMHLYSPLLNGTIFYPFVMGGGSGVTLFFILSGFILSYVYQEKFKKGSFLKNSKEFILNRIARIYPLHLFCLTYVACALFYFNMYSQSLEIFIYNLLLIQGWGIFGWSHASYDAAAWSISVEFFCYLCFPILIYFVNKTNKFILFLFFCILCFFSFFTRYNDYDSFFKPLFQSICWGDSEGRFYCGKAIGYYGIFFMIGVSLYPLAKKLPERKAWDYGCLLAFIMLFALFAFPVNQVDIYFNTLFGLLAVIYSILIISLYKTTGIFQRIFGNKIAVYLGDISFALYMTHEWVMETVLRISSPSLHLPLQWLSLFFALIIAALLYHFFEIPSRNFLRAWFKNKPSEKVFLEKAHSCIS